MKVNWKSANETCALRNMQLIKIDSFEEKSRVLKFVQNFYGTGFWTGDGTIKETQFSQRLGETLFNFQIKYLNCLVFRRRLNMFEYKLHISNCSSTKYSICYRENKVEDDDYDCDE